MRDKTSTKITTLSSLWGEYFLLRQFQRFSEKYAIISYFSLQKRQNMRYNRLMKFRLLVSLCLLFSCRAHLHAEIKVIPEREYFDAVHTELGRAKESIEISMFLIKLDKDSSNVKVLLDDLIMVRKRGVEVTVVLEDQRDNEEAYQYLKDKVEIKFDPLKENDAAWEIMAELLKACDRGVEIRIIFDSWEEEPFSRNEKAYNLLELAGIDVEYDLGSIATHNKLVTIDGERVLLGSANWTYNALEKNVEASISIDSPQIAGYFSNYFDELLKEIPEPGTKSWIPLPEYFLRKDGPISRLFNRGAVHSMKLYIHLLGEAWKRGQSELSFDYKGWYDTIYPDGSFPWTISKSVTMTKLLRLLRQEGLITKDSAVRELILLDPVTGEKWRFPQSDYFSISVELLEESWLTKLSSRELFFYLVNLSEFKNSSSKPFWFDSQVRLGERYGLNPKTVSQAAYDLMARNFIEIVHDIPDPGQELGERKANRYLLNPLPSEKELIRIWDEMASRHGEIYYLARHLAGRINEPEDPEAVGSIVMIIKIYGEEAVSEVISKVTRLSFANGKWELRYISGILKRDYLPLSMKVDFIYVKIISERKTRYS